MINLTNAELQFINGVLRQVHKMAMDVATDHVKEIMDNPNEYFKYSDYAAMLGSIIDKIDNHLKKENI